MGESDIAAVLAREGLVPGPDGYVWRELVALAARRGWHLRVEPVRTSILGGYVQALVWSDPRPTRRGAGSRRSARGRGATEELALAEALARMLRRAEPNPDEEP